VGIWGGKLGGGKRGREFVPRKHNCRILQTGWWGVGSGPNETGTNYQRRSRTLRFTKEMGISLRGKLLENPENPRMLKLSVILGGNAREVPPIRRLASGYWTWERALTTGAKNNNGHALSRYK